MAQRKTQTTKYWVEDFQISQSDIDHLYGVLLEQETPLSAEEMSLILVRFRVEGESSKPDSKRESHNQYLPTEQYEVGTRLEFGSMGFVAGEVTATRPGDNPAYGEYEVLQVRFSENETLEFASGLAPEHLHLPSVESETEDETPSMSPDELFIEYGGEVAEALDRELSRHDDLVRLAGRWFPKSLLANINSGHSNLAEAVLDMHAGGPLATIEIIEEAGMLNSVSDHLAEFSLNYALSQDPRFDEVGPAGKVLWFLTRLEPPEVQSPPPRLAYTPISSDASLLTEDLRRLELEIGDEHSDTPAPRSTPPQSVTVSLIYPHRRAGTLPLSPALKTMFPTAFESPRIRFTLVDEESGDQYPAWVVRPGGYVYGLTQFFERHDIPVGTYLTVKPSSSPGQVSISASLRKPRKEWVRSAVVDGNRVRFQNVQRPVSTSFDDLMIIDTPDPEAIDVLWRRLDERHVPLEQTMADLLRELATHSPQGSVHAKTLYSAVNLIKRSPPGPIFARLVALPEFEHVGGPYWRLGPAPSGD